MTSPEAMQQVPWSDAEWLNEPPRAEIQDGDLIVETANASDFWRTTGYGFVADNGHALLVALGQDEAIEVDFVCDLAALYDQAGLMLRVSETEWMKAGVEITGGEVSAAVVVTHTFSDWSIAPTPHWQGKLISVRASRSADAVTIRMKLEGEPWRTTRVAWLDPGASVLAGPMCCSPKRGGLVVRFTRFVKGPADAALHADAA